MNEQEARLRLAAAEAHVDQLIAMHRDVGKKVGLPREEFLMCMAGCVMANNPTIEDLESFALKAILAVDRLARQAPQ